ncbi:MAG TPA: Uma2 family endonuclease [Blastocatellia bacterium]|jgi:Uma2 family endonuclease|nr:Uma2 family endonuclease [Blastocatellia bacterium]
MTTTHKATIEDLCRVKGKAELVNGEIIQMPPTGYLPGFAASEILISLRLFERATKSGHAIGDNVGFRVNLPNRESFSPDAAWYVGPTTGMKFLQGAPTFAVEVRSEGDYGPNAERQMADKRRDYFAAGTLCVWDVDMQSAEVIKAYHADDPDKPITFRRGDLADAGQAAQGWSIPVDNLFP